MYNINIYVCVCVSTLYLLFPVFMATRCICIYLFSLDFSSLMQSLQFNQYLLGSCYVLNCVPLLPKLIC